MPTNLTITSEMIQSALMNFQNRVIDESLIIEVTAEIQRLITREDHAPPASEAVAPVSDGVDQNGEEAPAGEANDQVHTDDSVTVILKPRDKMQKLVIVYDPEVKIARDLQCLAYVVEIPAEEPPDGRTFDRRFSDAITSHNESRRGKKHPAETFRDALEKIPYDWLRYYKIRNLTENPVFVLLRGTEIPNPSIPQNNDSTIE